jgi:uroporphyrinogen decarboxylase
LQIFDSMGGILSDGNFMAASGDWMKQILTTLQAQVPVIVFSKGTHGNWPELAGLGAQVLSIDSNVRLSQVRDLLPGNLAVQGNFDPFLLSTNAEMVASEARRILLEMQGKPGHIFNLGHGVPPNSKLENIERLVEVVRSQPLIRSIAPTI